MSESNKWFEIKKGELLNLNKIARIRKEDSGYGFYLVCESVIVHVTYRYQYSTISERDKIYKNLKKALINENQSELQREVAELRQAILHLPGGPIYQDARENFSQLVESQKK